jgi:hypothetical protein
LVREYRPVLAEHRGDALQRDLLLFAGRHERTIAHGALNGATRENALLVR